ncbi:hypothetical protein [Bradyrhizobium iriomotense]|uniref:hypothetical protein n=1 Tax=Bradyrhizobium iriomotense TaxID=441950 RepID=UPI001B8A2506|nr:hypothetical protein [Bradyrhizobium iriomotense]MBR1133021.1 hypothetical protein [Bradyrhizobium iriomotense]
MPEAAVLESGGGAQWHFRTDPSNTKASTRDDLNNLGRYRGLLVVSPSDASADEMIAGDLKTAEDFGANVVEVVTAVKG